MARKSVVRALLIVAGILTARPGASATPSEIWLEVSGAGCPTVGDVGAVLYRLLPSTRTTSASTGASSAHVRVEDRGTTFRVSVGGARRTFEDAGRTCEERARIAAVFVHSVLEPPVVEPLVVTPAPKAPRPRPRARIELFGAFDAAPRTAPDNSLYSGGGGLRAFVGNRYVGGALGVSGLSPTTQSFGDVRARITRVAFDLSLRGMLRRGRFELSGDLGLAATLVSSESQGLSISQRVTSLEVGLRAAVQTAVWLADRVAPLLAVQVVVDPRPGAYLLAPAGTVGRLPYAWIGLIAGLAVKIN